MKEVSMQAWWMLLALLPIGAVAAPAVQDFVPQEQPENIWYSLPNLEEHQKS